MRRSALHTERGFKTVGVHGVTRPVTTARGEVVGIFWILLKRPEWRQQSPDTNSPRLEVVRFVAESAPMET